MFLTKEEEKMANGEYGETIRKSMDILIALGDIYGAEKFVDIKSAQVSGVSYKTIGQAGLEYLEDLASTAEIIYNENGTISDKSGIDLTLQELTLTTGRISVSHRNSLKSRWISVMLMGRLE